MIAYNQMVGLECLDADEIKEYHETGYHPYLHIPSDGNQPCRPDDNEGKRKYKKKIATKEYWKGRRALAERARDLAIDRYSLIYRDNSKMEERRFLATRIMKARNEIAYCDEMLKQWKRQKNAEVKDEKHS